MRVRPRRIQMKRTKGWRKPEGAVYVGRPTRWGNPYVVGGVYVRGWNNPLSTDYGHVEDAAMAVRLYRRWLFNARRSEGLVPELRGKDLACWCPLDQPCHADVLLELANVETPA
jgi:hypothetical protein